MKKNTEIYELIVGHLKWHKKFEPMDHFLIEQLQNAYTIYYDAWAKVNKEGATQKAKSGWDQKSGNYTVLQDAQKTIIDLQHKLGIYKIFGDKLAEIQKSSTIKGNPVDEI